MFFFVCGGDVVMGVCMCVYTCARVCVCACKIVWLLINFPSLPMQDHVSTSGFREEFFACKLLSYTNVLLL